MGTFAVTIGALDDYGCRHLLFEVRPGGHMTGLSPNYEAGELYLRESDANQLIGLLRLGEGAGTDLVVRPVAEECDHSWVDARNEVVESGEVCLGCGAFRAAPVGSS